MSAIGTGNLLWVGLSEVQRETSKILWAPLWSIYLKLRKFSAIYVWWNSWRAKVECENILYL